MSEQAQSLAEIATFYETQSGIIVVDYAASLAVATEGYIDLEQDY